MKLSRFADKRGAGSSRTVAQAVELLRAQPGGAWVGIPYRFLDRDEIYRQFEEAFGRDFHAIINYAIDNAPIRSVPIAQIRSIQHTVNRDRVEQYIRNPKMIRRGQRSSEHGGVIDLPVVVIWKGENILYDGNHRTTADMFRGAKTIEARFVDLDEILAGNRAASSTA